MEHQENPGAEVDAAPAAPPVVAEPSVLDVAAVEALRSRQAVLESRLARAEEENDAFVRSLRHAAAAAEELLAEAAAEADERRAATAAEIEGLLAVARAEADEVLARAARDADDVREAARAEARELVAVARADARDAQIDERRALAAAQAELVAAEQAIAADRLALVRLHGELAAGLRSLARAMGEQLDHPIAAAPIVPAVPVAPVFDDRAAVVAATEPDAHAFAATVRTGPHLAPEAGRLLAETAADLVRLPTAEHRPDPRELHDEEHLERAFDEFFSSEIEHEPSRRWILED